MKRLSKTKRGFTMVEILMVVAIIIILAAAVGISANDILHNAHAGQDSVSQRLEDDKQGISASEQKLQDYGF